MIIAWLIQPFSEEDYDNLLSISMFIISLICGIILLVFSLKFNIQAQAKKSWLLIASATFSWALGEFTVIYSEIILQVPSDPILSSIFLIIGYVGFFLGLVMQWRLMEIQIKKAEIAIIIVTFVICLVASLTIFNIPINLIDSDTLNELLSSAGYPTLDLLLTFFSGIILWKVKRRKIVFPWAVLTLFLINNVVIHLQQF